jgi:hypothetical protein
MQRSRQSISPKSAYPPIRRHEIERRLRRNQMVDADSLAEVIEVRAAAHADVLAGVDELAGRGISEGAGSATQAVARFEDRDLKSAGRQRGRRCQPG